MSNFPTSTPYWTDTAIGLNKYKLPQSLTKLQPSTLNVNKDNNSNSSSNSTYHLKYINSWSSSFRNEVLTWLMNTYKEPSVNTYYVYSNTDLGGISYLNPIDGCNFYLYMSSSVYTMYTLKYSSSYAQYTQQCFKRICI